MSRFATALAFGIVVSMTGAGSGALAQKADNWPSRPIRLIVPFPPGGGTDLVGRSVGNKLAEVLGQRIVIDNRGGAGGNIGAELAARAEPDGYTMFIGNIGAIAINPTLYAGKLPYDPKRDLAPVTLSSDALNILMVHPSLPVKSVKQLIDLARAKPDQLSYSSSGAGATDHLAGELFNRMLGVRTIHVPYKGGGPAAVDLAAGNVQLSFNTASAQGALWRAGKLRALAVLSPKRQPLFPDLPSIAETVPGYGVNNWYGFFVPARTARPIIDRLNIEINRILKMPDIISLHNGGGVIPLGTTPEEFARFIHAETEKWAKVIRDAGIRIE
ncbi:MAG: Bug family tripartite tricarboxylate transporter substrate binding protein [Betaproteobacteria bacterium]